MTYFFNWDGTLANTRSVLLASFREVLKELPIKTSDGLIENRLGTKCREIFREILRNLLLLDHLVIDCLVQSLKTLSVKGAFTLDDAVFTPSRIVRFNEEISLAEVAFAGFTLT